MVPVPEEFAAEVQRFLMETDMRATAARIGRTVEAEPVAALLRAMNERCRMALSMLADVTKAGRNATVGELATTMGWQEHETVGVVQELSELIWRVFGPMMGIVRTAPMSATSGSVDWNERQIVLWADLATAVLTAEAQFDEGV